MITLSNAQPEEIRELRISIGALDIGPASATLYAAACLPSLPATNHKERRKLQKMSDTGLIAKDEKFKCYVLLVNRNRSKLYKGGKYGTVTGSVGFWRFTKFRFAIGKSVKPFEFDRSTVFKKNRSLPLFVVNDLTKQAIASTLIEAADPDTDTKLNLLCKKSFWEAFGEQLKLSLGQTFIYFLAGFALFRFIEYIISIFVGRGI